MFAIADICHIAIQIETNGEAVYRQASEMVKDLKTKKMLAQLADDELGHAKWFENLKLKHIGPSDFSELEEAGRALLQGMMEDQTFSLDVEDLARADCIAQIIDQSITFEKDTILFYEMLHSFIDDKNVLRQLDYIIAEEHSHIEKLKDYVSTNRTC